MKSLINTTLFKEQLRRFWIIGAVFALAYLLTIIIPLYNTSPHWADNAPQVRQLVNILSWNNAIIATAMILVPFCIVMALYPYNFNGKAVSKFFTLPVTRRQIFCTNFAVGAVLTLLPLLVLCLMLLIPIRLDWDINSRNMLGGSWVHFPQHLFPNGVEPGELVNTPWQVLTFFARTSIGFMFYLAVLMLAVSLSGNRVISVLLCVFVPFLPVLIYMFGSMAAVMYIFGIGDVFLDAIITDILRLSNPLALAGNGGPWWWFTWYVVLAALLYGGAYLCSIKRKHERAGDSVVFAGFKVACVFTLSLLGMVAMGMFLMVMSNSRVGLYIGYVLGFVLMYFIAQMIAEKSFNVKHKAKAVLKYAGIIAAVYIGFMLFATFGMPYYVNRVPTPSRVVGVQFGHSWEAQSRVFVHDEDVIAQVIDVHHEILNNRSYLRRVFWGSATDNNIGRNTRNITIVYLLDNGSQVQRGYLVSNDFFINSGMDDIVRMPAVQLAQHRALHRLEVVQSISITVRVDERTAVTHNIIGSAHIASLTEAIKEDFVRDVESWGSSWEVVETNWEERIGRVSAQYSVFPGYSMYWTNVHIPLFDGGAVYTWLNEHGFVMIREW